MGWKRLHLFEYSHISRSDLVAFDSRSSLLCNASSCRHFGHKWLASRCDLEFARPSWRGRIVAPIRYETDIHPTADAIGWTETFNRVTTNEDILADGSLSLTVATLSRADARTDYDTFERIDWDNRDESAEPAVTTEVGYVETATTNSFDPADAATNSYSASDLDSSSTFTTIGTPTGNTSGSGGDGEEGSEPEYDFTTTGSMDSTAFVTEFGHSTIDQSNTTMTVRDVGDTDPAGTGGSGGSPSVPVGGGFYSVDRQTDTLNSQSNFSMQITGEEDLSLQADGDLVGTSDSTLLMTSATLYDTLNNTYAATSVTTGDDSSSSSSDATVTVDDATQSLDMTVISGTIFNADGSSSGTSTTSFSGRMTSRQYRAGLRCGPRFNEAVRFQDG